ncbi:MAG: leucine-rich repeat protein, partial [Allobaculum sp.]|nr:leucine-rich repeat protein [Allobaculum sp.]
ATIYPSNASNKRISWESNNITVATIDHNGVVKVGLPGKATITATCGEMSASCEITAIEGTGPKDAVKVGDYYYILNKTNKTAMVTWNNKGQQTGYNYQSLSDINIPSKITYSNVSYSVTSIDDYAFTDCPATTLVLPSSVTKLGNRSFEGAKVKSVDLSSVTEYDDAVFGDCPNLVSVTGMSKVKVIKACMFAGCVMLETVGELTDVEKIENGAFYHCDKLSSLKFGNKLKEIETDALWFTLSLESIVFPASLVDAGKVDEMSENTVIYCNALTPPEAYASRKLTGRILYVPESAVSKYKAKAPWNEYTINPVAITSMEFSSDTETIEVGASIPQLPVVS